MKEIYKDWVIVFLLLFGVAGFAEAREIAVIGNSQNGTASLSQRDVKSIFLGDKEFFGSVKVLLVDQAAGSRIRAGFMGKALDSDPETFDKYWLNKQFQDGGTPPKKFGSSAEVIDEVGRNSGAIGYVYKDEVAGKKSVKILFVIGE